MILDVTTLLWSHCHTLKTSIFMLFSKQFEEWKVCKYGSDLRFKHKYLKDYENYSISISGCSQIDGILKIRLLQNNN